jgi:hypothetical protein
MLVLSNVSLFRHLANLLEEMKCDLLCLPLAPIGMEVAFNPGLCPRMATPAPTAAFGRGIVAATISTDAARD